MTTSINPTADGIVDLDDPSIHVPKGIQPLVDVWMRDTRVTLGHDGAYYLTGTTRAPDTGEINAGRFSDGIRLWRSEDLKNWEDLGLVWSIEAEGGALADLPVYENGTGSTYSPEAFRREVLPRLAQPEGDQSIQVRRGVWAPELNWLPRRGEYLLSFCLNTNIAIPPAQWTHHGLFGGNYFLKTESGDPRGPWKLVREEPMTDHIDGTVFEDDDPPSPSGSGEAGGSIWFIWQNGRMARFNDRLDGFDQICDPWQVPWSPEPTREGPFVVKREGRYHLFLTIHSHRTPDGSVTFAHHGHGGADSFGYDLVQCSADRLTGPYGPRSLVALGVGHGHPLQDRNGDWWLGCFGCPTNEYMPFPEPCRPYLVPMQWQDGLFRPRH